MKNKKKIFLLIILVLIIWGYIIYRFILAAKGDTACLEQAFPEIASQHVFIS